MPDRYKDAKVAQSFLLESPGDVIKTGGIELPFGLQLPFIEREKTRSRYVNPNEKILTIIDYAMKGVKKEILQQELLEKLSKIRIGEPDKQLVNDYFWYCLNMTEARIRWEESWEKFDVYTEFELIFDDLLRGFEKLHDMWNEEREKNLLLQVVKKRDYIKERKRSILKNVASPERDKFAEIAAITRRFKAGKNRGMIVYSDLARKCRMGFPQGIAGRKIDDKFAKQLCEAWDLT